MREERFIELDILRGFAICLMIVLHFMWDLDFFQVYPLNNNIYQINKTIAFLFLVLVGISLSVANKRKTPLQQLKHGLRIFNVGMGLTIITLIFMPDRPILFGVLHCIGLSVILSVPFLAVRRYAVYVCSALGFSIMSIGFIIESQVFNNPTIPQLILGFHQKEMWNFTIDYFPLIPWFGIVLIGIAAGNVLYRNGKRQFNIPTFLQHKMTLPVSILGKHSLSVYLVHQPVMVFLIKYIIIPLRPLLNI